MGGGGAPPPPPAQQQVSQTSEFPEELKPYITDILERSKTRIEARDAEGYLPYPAPRLAEFTPEQLEAQTGIAGLARTGLASDPTLASSRTYMQPALDATQASLGQFDTAAAQQYMSPYMQSVIDIQKREAMRSGDVQRQEIGTQAVGAGGFGGSRQAIAEAEQRRNEAQLLNDIQAKGQQAAFEQAGAQFERQKGRELTGGQQFAALGEQAPRLALAELGALSGVGAAQQEQGQRALDIGYQQFQEELQYPERTLQEYSSIIRGFPLTPNQFDVTQTATPPPNLATQLAGVVGTGAGAFKAFAKDGGQIKRKAGGLADLPTKRYVKKANGTLVGDMGQDDTINENLLTTSSVDPLYAFGGLSRLASQDRSLQRKRIEDFLAAQEIREAEAEEDRQRDYGLALMQASAPLIAGQTSLLEGLGSAASTFAGDAGKIKKEERAAKRASERLPLEMGGMLTDLAASQYAEDLKLLEITSDINIANRKFANDNKVDAKTYDALNKNINDSLTTRIKVDDKKAGVLGGQALKAGLAAYTKAIQSRDPDAFVLAQEAINNVLKPYFNNVGSQTGNSAQSSSNNNPGAGGTPTNPGRNAGKVLNQSTNVNSIGQQ
jgi:hypothetical protein